MGAAVGIMAGYFGGWIGGILMRFTDLMIAFPALLLAIVLAAIFKPSLLIVARPEMACRRMIGTNLASINSTTAWNISPWSYS